MKFDLAVLDEAQRIKNQRSTTSQIVRSVARRRNWALTGTPVENSAEDLVGIFEFLVPGHLSPDKAEHDGPQRERLRAAADQDRVLTELPQDVPRRRALDGAAGTAWLKTKGAQIGEMGDRATIQHVFELILRLKQICNFDPATDASDSGASKPTSKR